MSNSIAISGLNEQLSVVNEDFFPLVDSGSMTTFKVSMETLKNFIAYSGSVISSSWASSSLSASWAPTQNSTLWADASLSSSWASSSLSASWASSSVSSISSSFASRAFSSTTSSWASQSFNSVTSSFASRSFSAESSSWASSSVSSISSSWATQSLSSSYASTSSYALNSIGGFSTGMILPYAYTESTALPSGWLNCNGQVYNTNSYVDLKNLIGTNFGEPLYVRTDIQGDSVPAVPGDKGIIMIHFHLNSVNGIRGGSGLFTVQRLATGSIPASGVTLVNKDNNTDITYAPLQGPMTYSILITDTGFFPAESYILSCSVPYVFNGSSLAPWVSVFSASVNSTASYRLPQMSSTHFQLFSYYTHPLYWIIKT